MKLVLRSPKFIIWILVFKIWQMYQLCCVYIAINFNLKTGISWASWSIYPTVKIRWKLNLSNHVNIWWFLDKENLSSLCCICMSVTWPYDQCFCVVECCCVILLLLYLKLRWSLRKIYVNVLSSIFKTTWMLVWS